MSRICQITKKKPITGYRRSHAMNATKRWFIPNIHTHRFWSDKKKRFIILRVSAHGIRTIDKIGIDTLLFNISPPTIKKNIKGIHHD